MICEKCGNEGASEFQEYVMNPKSVERVLVHETLTFCDFCYNCSSNEELDRRVLEKYERNTIDGLKLQVKDLERQLDEKNLQYHNALDQLEIEKNKPLKVKIIDSIISYLKE